MNLASKDLQTYQLECHVSADKRDVDNITWTLETVAGKGEVYTWLADTGLVTGKIQDWLQVRYRTRHR